MKIGYTFHAGDLFHYGHLHQLLECRKHCEYLIVGVLTDQAIASYKRLPIIPYTWRAQIYKNIKCVDLVIAQDSRDPTSNLENFKPNVLFHGDDWSEIPGEEWMLAHGGKVIRTPYFCGISTKEIIERIRD